MDEENEPDGRYLPPHRSGFRGIPIRSRYDWRADADCTRWYTAFTEHLIEYGAEETFAQMIRLLQEDYDHATINGNLPRMYPCAVSRFGVRYYYEAIPGRREIAWGSIRALCTEYAVRRGLYLIPCTTSLAFGAPREWREWNWIA